MPKLNSFDDAIDTLVALELDPERKARLESRRGVMKSVSGKLKLPLITDTSRSMIEEAKVWNRQLVKSRKQHGKNSDEYARAKKSMNRVLDALETVLEL